MYKKCSRIKVTVFKANKSCVQKLYISISQDQCGYWCGVHLELRYLGDMLCVDGDEVLC